MQSTLHSHPQTLIKRFSLPVYILCVVCSFVFTITRQWIHKGQSMGWVERTSFPTHQFIATIVFLHWDCFSPVWPIKHFKMPIPNLPEKWNSGPELVRSDWIPISFSIPGLGLPCGEWFPVTIIYFVISSIKHDYTSCCLFTHDFVTC